MMWFSGVGWHWGSEIVGGSTPVTSHLILDKKSFKTYKETKSHIGETQERKMMKTPINIVVQYSLHNLHLGFNCKPTCSPIVKIYAGFRRLKIGLKPINRFIDRVIGQPSCWAGLAIIAAVTCRRAYRRASNCLGVRVLERWEKLINVFTFIRPPAHV